MNEKAQSYIVRANKAIDEVKTDADYLNAIEELKKALTYAPDCPDIYYNIGTLYDTSISSGLLKDPENYKNAIKYLKKYLELKPDAENKQDIQDRISELGYEYEQLTRKSKKLVSFGILGGLNFSSFSYAVKQAPVIDNGMGFGGRCGIFLEFRLSDLISIQPGVNISSISVPIYYRYLLSNDGSGNEEYQDGNMYTSYAMIEFPINLLFKYNFGKNRLFGGIGTVISQTLSNGDGFDNKFTNVGLNLKVGYSYRKFFIEFGYNAGMTDISLGNDVIAKMNSLYGSLGLRF